MSAYDLTAAEVDRLLVVDADLPVLSCECCGWSGPPGSIVALPEDEHGTSVVICCADTVACNLRLLEQIAADMAEAEAEQGPPGSRWFEGEEVLPF